MFLFSRFFNEPIQNVENIKQLTMASEISTSQTNYFRDNRRKDRWEKNNIIYLAQYWAVRMWEIFVSDFRKFLGKGEVHWSTFK